MVIEFDFKENFSSALAKSKALTETKKEKLFLVKSMSKAEDHIGGQVDGQKATTTPTSSVHKATKEEEEEYYRLLSQSMSFTPSVLS